MGNTIENRIETFFSHYPTRHFTKDSMVFRSGQKTTTINYIQSGFVRQFFISREGAEATIQVFKPKSFFPLAILLAGAENQYDFQATTDTNVSVAPFSEVLDFIKSDNEILFYLLLLFSRGLVGLSTKVESLMVNNAYERLVSLLVYLAKNYGEDKNGETVITLPLTQYDIASWIGVQRETVSRQLEKLAAKGLLVHKNHILIIKDIGKLKKEYE